MRPIKALTTCAVIMLSILLADPAFAQRGGGGGTGGGGMGGGGMGGGMGGGNFPQGGSMGGNRTSGNLDSRLEPEPEGRSAASEIQARIQSRSYVFAENGQKLPFAVLLPKKLDKKKAAPLVIVLHDADATPESILASLGESADRHGFILVAPQGYTRAGWYGYGQYVKGLVDPEVSRLSERDVMNVLDNMRVEYKIDSRRIYVVGHSMGGIGAIYLGAKYPEIWAAVGALSPRLTKEAPAEVAEFVDTPIVIEHGERDELVPVDLIRTWVAGLKEREVPMKYYEIRGGTQVSTLLGGAERVFDFFDKNSRPVGKGAP